MRLTLRAGERVYLNGAVLRADRKVSLELLNDATFLLEAHVLQAEQATTPLRQLYFAVQTMLIEPGRAGPARELFRTLRAGILAATAEAEIRDGVAAAEVLVEAGRPFEALKLIRGLYAAEAARLEPAASAPGPVRPSPPPERLAVRPRRSSGARLTLPPGPEPAAPHTKA